MEFTIRRLLEATLVARRNDAAWIRAALSHDRHDLTGRLSDVQAGGVMVDERQRWELDVYGRFTSDGNARPGSRLVMLDGVAGGADWECLSVTGQAITVVDGAGDPVDLVAAGVAAGDAYEIRVDQYERAVAWFAKTAIRVMIGYPQDPSVFPCYTVTLGAANELLRPIGNHGRHVGSASGPVREQLVSNWHESYSLECYALTPDECVWMYRALEYAYRGWIMYLERVFLERVAAQGSEVRVDGLAPHDVYVRSFTIGGALEKFVEREVPWLLDSDHPANAVQVADLGAALQRLRSP